MQTDTEWNGNNRAGVQEKEFIIYLYKYKQK